MSVSGIRTKLATALNTVSGLKAYETWPVPLPGEFPCAIILPVSGNWNINLPRSGARLKWAVTILTGIQGGVIEAQQVVDGFLAATGTTSVKYTMEHYAYSNEPDYVYVTGFRDYGPRVIDETAYLGATFDIETVGG
jgi:hypothetical protein